MQLEIEKEEWKTIMMIKLEKEAQELQNKAAAALEKQRDEEIELVIARLEEEAQSTHAQLSSEFDAKLVCVTEQYQAQVIQSAFS